LGNTGLSFEIYAPKDFGLEYIDPKEEGGTLKENAEIKARAYFGKVSLPILANDTGFYVEGEGFVHAPKRKALDNTDETTLTKEQIAEKLLGFWKNIAKKYGGKVDAAWLEVFALLEPNGEIHFSDSRREVILTDQVFGDPHIQMPVRALYISKTTNKPAVQHTEADELQELKPITDALRVLLSRLRGSDVVQHRS
jgi:hypothetical protein